MHAHTTTCQGTTSATPVTGSEGSATARRRKREARRVQTALGAILARAAAAALPSGRPTASAASLAI